MIFAAVGALGGLALAIGELDALWISLSVVAALVVLVDYRVGAVLLVLMLPVSDSNLFPHALMGMTGVNPVNLLLAGTLVSYAVRAGRGAYPGRLLQPQLIWLYIVPIVIGGVLGSFHVDEIVPVFMEELVVSFHNVPGYLRDMVMKPLFIPLFALLLGVAVARSEKAERYIVPIALSVWIIAMIEIVFVAVSGVRLGRLASADMRGFFLAIGMHANDLGRLFAIAYALLLFTWWETKNQALKTFLFVSMGVLAFALLLTFSRGAFVGFLLVNALFLGWKFNFKTASLAILALVVCALLMPGYVYNRVLLGIGEGDMDAVSAGRIDGIWLPLLPEMLKSPLWGQGLGSIMWSFPMQIDAMLVVGHPHNAFLETVLDMGLIGLGLLVRVLPARLARLPRPGQQRLPQPGAARLLPGRHRGAAVPPDHRHGGLQPAAGIRGGLPVDGDRHDVRAAGAQTGGAGAKAGELMFIEKVVREGAAPAAGGPEKRLSVCFVAPHAWPVLSRDPHIKVVGGAEVQQATIARLLAASGLRVSMVTLDYGQPDGAVVDGVTVHKAFAPDAGLPVLRFLHPRMSSMLRAMRAADADVYYYRSTSMWAGVVAEFARRHGRRSIYAGASDRDFAPGTGGQIRYARDRWLFGHALRSVDRIVVQNLQQQAACRALTGRDSIHIPSCYPLPADSQPRRERRPRAVGRHHPDAQAPGAAARAGAPAAAAALRHDRRRDAGASRALQAHPRGSGRRAERRVQGLPAAGRGRAVVRPRARARHHLALRGHAQRLPAGLGARRAHRRHARRRRAPRRRAGVPGISTTWRRLPPRSNRCSRIKRPGKRVCALPRVLRAHAFAGRGAGALLQPAARAGGGMTAAAKALGKGMWMHGLKRRALSLGAVKAFDHGLQFLLPVVLVRCLDAATFGEYRLLWLVVGTLMAFATLNMAGTLYFFVPRSEPARKRLFVHQTLFYLAAAGVVCGLAVSPWNPWLPPAMAPLESHGALVPLFVALWVVAILLDYLPTIDERIRWQAWATLSVALLRALLVGAGAWFTGEMRVILWLLVATVAVKLLMLLAYIRLHHGLGRPWFERAAFAEQIGHAAPIGLSNAAYTLRGQADQWVAASLFALTSFAAFSIAALVGAGGARVPPLGAGGDPAQHEPAAGRRRRARHDGDEQPRQRDRRHAAVPAARLRLRLRRRNRHRGLHRGLRRGGAGDAHLRRRHARHGGRDRQHRAAAAPGRVRAQGVAADAGPVGGGEPRRGAALRPGRRRRRQRAGHLLRPRPHAAAHLAPHRPQPAPHAGLALAGARAGAAPCSPAPPHGSSRTTS